MLLSFVMLNVIMLNVIMHSVGGPRDRDNIHNSSISLKLMNMTNKLLYTCLERLASDKHCGLLGAFVIYEENEVL
jgi:hypothetical protein